MARPIVRVDDGQVVLRDPDTDEERNVFKFDYTFDSEDPTSDSYCTQVRCRGSRGVVD